MYCSRKSIAILSRRTGRIRNSTYLCLHRNMNCSVLKPGNLIGVGILFIFPEIHEKPDLVDTCYTFTETSVKLFGFLIFDLVPGVYFST